ncbi:MAG: hypothetical protein HFI09_01250 [Bacilli bacterium]|nr:hypothetical protein [Bacilli bacterium]
MGIKADNNLIETIHWLYQNSLTMEVQQLYTYFKENPIISHHIGLKDLINLKLYFLELYFNEQESMWDTYFKILQIRKIVFKINQEQQRKFQVLLVYLSNLIQQFEQIIVCNGYIKVQKILNKEIPTDLKELHAFFLDTSDIPIESLCGYYSYLNPIFKLIHAQTDNHDFLLYDAMCEEISNVKDEMIQDSLRSCKSCCSLNLKQMIHSISTLADCDFDYYGLYCQNYFNACSRLLKLLRKNECKVQKKNRVKTTPDYEYLGSFLD